MTNVLLWMNTKHYPMGIKLFTELLFNTTETLLCCYLTQLLIMLLFNTAAKSIAVLNYQQVSHVLYLFPRDTVLVQ